MNSSSDTLRTLVDAEIDRTGRSQTSIATEAGISQAAISKYLCGHGGMSFDLIDAVLGVCGRRLILTTVPIDNDVDEPGGEGDLL